MSHPGTMVRPTYLKTMSGVFSRYGYTGFARGMVGTAFRDGGFTGAYMWGADYFAKRFQDQGLKDVTYSALAGGATAGVLGAVVTHPFDTWKTRRQKGLPTDFFPEGFVSSVQNAFREAYKAKGAFAAWKAGVDAALGQPYRGFGPRSARVVMAVTVMSLLFEKLKEEMVK